jgi:hypothetical protein
MAQGEPVVEHRAEPPRAPQPTRALLRLRAERRGWLALRDREARSSTVRGLLWLALAILAASLARAGLERVFVPGWWRP